MGMIQMTVSSCSARATSCTSRRGTPAEGFSVRWGGVPGGRAGAPRRFVHEVACAEQDETIIRYWPLEFKSG